MESHNVESITMSHGPSFRVFGQTIGLKLIWAENAQFVNLEVLEKHTEHADGFKRSFRLNEDHIVQFELAHDSESD